MGQRVVILRRKNVKKWVKEWYGWNCTNRTANYTPQL